MNMIHAVAVKAAANVTLILQRLAFLMPCDQLAAFILVLYVLAQAR